MIRETLLSGCGGGPNGKTVTRISACDPDSTQGRLEEVGELSSHQWLTILLEKERAIYVVGFEIAWFALKQYVSDTAENGPPTPWTEQLSAKSQ